MGRTSTAERTQPVSPKARTQRTLSAPSNGPSRACFLRVFSPFSQRLPRTQRPRNLSEMEDKYKYPLKLLFHSRKGVVEHQNMRTERIKGISRMPQRSKRHVRVVTLCAVPSPQERKRRRISRSRAGIEDRMRVQCSSARCLSIYVFELITPNWALTEKTRAETERKT